MQQAVGVPHAATGAATTNNNPNNNVNNSNIMALVNLQPGVTAAAQATAANAATQSSIYNGNNAADPSSVDPIELLISMNANGSLDEYYPALAIHLMMKTIKNSVNVGVRKDAIQALVYAMRSLDTKCVNYVELVIPPFLDLIKSMNDNLVIDLTVQLGSLVSYFKKHIEPYLTNILAFVEQYWNTHEKQVKMIVALLDLVQSIANVMDIEFKRYLPKVLPLILKQLKIEVHDRTFSNTSKILNLLRLCTCCLENYVHLILSQFAEYLTIRDNLKLKQEIMFTIYTFAQKITLSDNCAILFQSFIKILEQNSANLPAPHNQVLSNNPLIMQSIAVVQQQNAALQERQAVSSGQGLQVPNVLSITYLLFSNTAGSPASLTNEKLGVNTDLGTLTIETLYLLARQMNGRFFVYALMFDRILLKNKAYAKLYEQLMVYCRESTYHTIWTNQFSNLNSLSSPFSTNSTEVSKAGI